MRIGMIAPPWFPLPPKGYGGIELVVHLLTEGLVARGHDVTLFASGDSETLARLSFVYGRAPSEKIATHGHIEIIHGLEAYSQAREFDVIHDHDGLASRAMGVLVHRLVGTPVVATLHGPADPLTQEILSSMRHGLRFIAISEYQRGGLPELPFVATIPNAIDIERHPFSAEKDDYLLFIGRMIADKGAHTAIEVARRVEGRLIMAGKLNEEAEHEYFAEAVEPYLSDRIYFRGEVDMETKVELYRRARCTLFPIQWPEPFGLVMIESLAAGTPVIAFRRGSVPEVIEHGRTGFIVEDVDEMVEALGQIDEIDPAECRRAAEERFGVEGFVRAHERAYRSLLDEGPAWATGSLPGPLTAERAARPARARSAATLRRLSYRAVAARWYVCAMGLPYDDIHLIADPLYGYLRITVPRTDGEVAEATVIDDPWVQRLKRIHQLQSSWWVFPTAEHSRFAHSLGAMHLAGEFGQHLYDTLADEAPDTPSRALVEETLRMAGLLHDVGHGPFSHFFDDQYLHPTVRARPRAHLAAPDRRRAGRPAARPRRARRTAASPPASASTRATSPG